MIHRAVDSTSTREVLVEIWLVLYRVAELQYCMRKPSVPSVGNWKQYSREGTVASEEGFDRTN